MPVVNVEAYDERWLREQVAGFEREHGVATGELLVLHRAGDRLEGLSNADRHLWLSCWLELEKLGEHAAGRERRRRLMRQ